MLVDGKFLPELPVPCRAIVGGDGKISAIQAASILAKTERDRAMIELGKIYQGYLFEKNKGYPTLEHRRMIMRYGPSPVHRRSFTFRDP